jgi:hypothetical protein
LNINVTYDGSVSNAPSGFTWGVANAISYLETQFSSPITININVGYGECAGQALDSGTLGQSQCGLISASYSSVRNALLASQAPGATTLPTISPISGSLYLSRAEAKALGLLSASSAVDGYVGFSSDPNVFSYVAGANPAYNQYYFIGVVEHEVTELMGRMSFLDQAGQYTVADLYRYASSGVRSTAPGGSGSTAYFSLDGGATNLGSWNNYVQNGDLGDWYGSNIPASGADACSDYAPAGTLTSFSQSDIQEMRALGWASGSTWNFVDSRMPLAMVAGDFSGSGTDQLVASFSGAGTYSWTKASQSWTLIDRGTPDLMASADFTGSGSSQLVGVFGGYGTYTWTAGGGWSKIDGGTPYVLTDGDYAGTGRSQLAGVFKGYGTYTWTSGSGWQKIDAGTPKLLTSGDFKGLGHDQLAGVFAGYGTFTWSNTTGWQKIDSGIPTQLTTGNFNNTGKTELAGYFAGYGTFIWDAGSGWAKIDSSAAAGLASVDLNGDGKNELAEYFPGQGLYVWQSGVGWNKYDNTSALPTSAQQALFAVGNFAGGAAQLPAIALSGSGIWVDPPSAVQTAQTPAALDTTGGGDNSVSSLALLTNYMASSFVTKAQSGSLVAQNAETPLTTLIAASQAS